jgi:hypothetical protein
LAAIVLILSMLLAGITILAHAYHVGAMDQTQAGYQSVLSQLAGAVIGHGTVILSRSAACSRCCACRRIRVLSICLGCAATGICRATSLPPGRRLVNSVGIVWLAVGAGVLLTAFDGITDQLIPLFAVGAFLAFTLSQSGMAVHWSRQPRESGRLRLNYARLAINATGAVATGVSLTIILAAKFIEGAWITVLVIPCVLALLKVIKRYYDQIDRQLVKDTPLTITDERPPIVVIPIRGPGRKGGALRLAAVFRGDSSAFDTARGSRRRGARRQATPTLARHDRASG